jgi:hypothetical protein
MTSFPEIGAKRTHDYKRKKEEDNCIPPKEAVA